MEAHNKLCKGRSSPIPSFGWLRHFSRKLCLPNIRLTMRKLIRSIGIVVPALSILSCATNIPTHTLELDEMGSFYVGGETSTLNYFGFSSDAVLEQSITVGQTYVNYHIPTTIHPGSLPLVLIHGCCLSGVTYETTPDGRMGWQEYFLRNGRPTYVVDRVNRGRAGFDQNLLIELQKEATNQNVLHSPHGMSEQFMWSIFRFGDVVGEPYSNLRFPIEHIGTLTKQFVPDFMLGSTTLPIADVTNIADLAEQLGGAVLISHSQSGLFPLHAATINAIGIRGIVSIEGCSFLDFSDEEFEMLADIPMLFLRGDFLGWPDNLPEGIRDCDTNLVQRISDLGGNVTVIDLPELGIRGNSHMLMHDDNNLEIADIILDWIDENT